MVHPCNDHAMIIHAMIMSSMPRCWPAAWHVYGRAAHRVVHAGGAVMPVAAHLFGRGGWRLFEQPHDINMRISLFGV